MINDTEYKVPSLIIVLHVALGVLFAIFKPVASFFAIAICLLGVQQIVSRKNINNEAALWSAYIVGFEIILRITGSFLPWDFGKYTIIIFLLLGISYDKDIKQRNCSWIYIILLLLLPAIIPTLTWSNRIRIDILSSINGILSLSFSALYFYRRNVDWDSFKKIISFCVFPIITCTVYLMLKTPDYDEISFGAVANFSTSGGYGPNQVATILGLGITILVILIMTGSGFSKHRIFDYALFAIMVFRSLFTFSRGGNVAALLSILFFYVILRTGRGNRSKSIKSILPFVITGVILLFTIEHLNDITNNLFAYRFSGKNSQGEVLDMTGITTNRNIILKHEFELFLKNPLGCGYYGSSHFRNIYYHDEVMTHNEFGRLLSENGIFGIIIILFMIIKPLGALKRYSKENGAWLALFVVYSFSTMMHSAMRLSIAGFLYGLAFTCIVYNDNLSDNYDIGVPNLRY